MLLSCLLWQCTVTQTYKTQTPVRNSSRSVENVGGSAPEGREEGGGSGDDRGDPSGNGQGTGEDEVDPLSPSGRFESNVDEDGSRIFRSKVPPFKEKFYGESKKYDEWERELRMWKLASRASNEWAFRCVIGYCLKGHASEIYLLNYEKINGLEDLLKWMRSEWRPVPRFAERKRVLFQLKQREFEDVRSFLARHRFHKAKLQLDWNKLDKDGLLTDMNTLPSEKDVYQMLIAGMNSFTRRQMILCNGNSLPKDYAELMQVLSAVQEKTDTEKSMGFGYSVWEPNGRKSNGSNGKGYQRRGNSRRRNNYRNFGNRSKPYPQIKTMQATSDPPNAPPCQTEPKSKKWVPKKDVECWNCYQKGHWRNKCKNKQVFKCFNCGELGHKRDRCDKPKKGLRGGSERKKRTMSSMKATEEKDEDGDDCEEFMGSSHGGQKMYILKCLLQEVVTHELEDDDLLLDVETENMGTISCAADTGANLCAVSAAMVKRENLKVRKWRKTFRCLTANGEITLREFVPVLLKNKETGDKKVIPFFIISNLPYDYVIGRQVLRWLGYELRLMGSFSRSSGGSANIMDSPDDHFKDYQLLPTNSGGKTRDPQTHKKVLNMVRLPEDDKKQMDAFETLCEKSDVSPENKKRLGNILREFKDLKAEHSLDVGLLKDHDFPIELEDDKKIHNTKPYPLNAKHIDEVKRQIRELLKNGWIRESQSPYASPVILVDKKNGEKRMCVDYRVLNLNTKKMRWPLPKIGPLIEELGRMKVFTTVDLRGGYHHIRIREKDKEKTAFIVPFGHFEMNRMGFGFSNAPPHFQRAMQQVFKGFNQLFPNLDYTLQIYLDDVILATKDEETHLKILPTFLKRFREANMKLSWKKCHILKKKLTYLGHEIVDGKIGPDPEYQKKILKLKKPENKKEVKRFTGMIQWLSKFIPRLSGRMRNIVSLQKKKVPFIWTHEHDAEFEDIQKAVRDIKYLRQPDTSKRFYVECDASEFAIGATLLQKEGEILVPVAYMSRKLDETQHNWFIAEKELYAVIKALEKWRHLLLSGHFEIFTDHKNLVALFNPKRVKKSSRLDRWAVMLCDFDFTARWLKGDKNIPADYLSREGHLVLAKVMKLSPAYVADRSVQDELKRILTDNLNRVDYYRDESSRIAEEMRQEADLRKDIEHQSETMKQKFEMITLDKRFEKRFSLEEIRKFQMEDPTLVIIRNALISGNYKLCYQLTRHENKLLKSKWFSIDDEGTLKADDGKRIVVPEGLQTFMMEYFHEGPSGHHKASRRI